jgi:hypothetical protein
MNPNFGHQLLFYQCYRNSDFDRNDRRLEKFWSYQKISIKIVWSLKFKQNLKFLIISFSFLSVDISDLLIMLSLATGEIL